MSIQDFIISEKKETLSFINEALNDGDMKQEELDKDFINQLNDEIENLLLNHLRSKVKFDLISNFSGEYYKSMLGRGEQISYNDLREILQRIYLYHHKDQTFTIKFEEYSKVVTYEVMENNKNIARFILDILGNEWKLNTSDFN